MLKSMTAFGRASISAAIGHFSIEIQSVNRKFLEINAFLPPELSRFELEIKRWISAKISRGQVNVRLNAKFEQSSPVSVSPNLLYVKQLTDAWQAIGTNLGLKKPIDPNDILQLLARNPNVMRFEENLKDDENFLFAIKEVLESALAPFLQMRITEGAALAEDIRRRLGKMREAINFIETKTPDAPKKYYQKLKERIEEVIAGSSENEERILREIALYAEKIDISEEITRFRSHLAQCEQLLDQKEHFEGVGKTLEFMVQEINREANTIGSKSMDAEISRAVVEIKSELEKIREQLQNVE